MLLFSLIGVLISIGGAAFVVARHWREGLMIEDDIAREAIQHPPTIFEHAFGVARERLGTLWHTKLRERCFIFFEQTIAILESGLKYLTLRLRSLRTALRRRQETNGNGTSHYWTHLNSWNNRRLKLRRRKVTQEQEPPSS